MPGPGKGQFDHLPILTESAAAVHDNLRTPPARNLSRGLRSAYSFLRRWKRSPKRQSARRASRTQITSRAEPFCIVNSNHSPLHVTLRSRLRAQRPLASTPH
eukprot:1046379-Prorocentrum_lima.AAC.1